MIRIFILLFVLTIPISFVPIGTSHAHEPVVTDLEIPWSCDDEFRVSQAHNGKTHQGWSQYAWDFATPEGTVVTAPVDGTVRKVRDDSTRYGCDSSYGWDANYVVIDMHDGFDVLLLHLQADSALVSEGDEVRRGQPLARVGNSGWVCGTHLHMQVQRTCTSWWCPSVPASFVDGYLPERGHHLRPTYCAEEVETELATSWADRLRAAISIVNTVTLIPLAVPIR